MIECEEVYERPDFEPLSDAEAASICGTLAVKVGTCAVLGYACGLSKGGARGGVCLLFGVVKGD
jgi:hypothetical protein